MAGDAEKEFLASLALVHTKGIGPRTWKALVLHYGSAIQAVECVAEWSLKGLAREDQASSFAQRTWEAGVENERRALAKRDDHLLLWTNDAYPPLLKEIPDPPLYLYYRGRVELLAGPCLAFVGARQCSKYGLETVGLFSFSLSSKGVTIVSGFAHGIDRRAHMEALRAPGSSIAVLGTGLDLVYPAANRDLWSVLEEKGLLITEFPPGTNPEAANFPRRNRIISGISMGVVVGEAERKSGSLITAKLALEQGRDVFAIPGPVHMRSYEGCHDLMKQGAIIAASVDDILLEFCPRLMGSERQDSVSKDSSRGWSSSLEVRLSQSGLSVEEMKIAQLLQKGEKMHIDDLIRAACVDSATMSRMLLMLEMKNIVRQFPGTYYGLAV